jgi:hypothetical protein
VAKGRYDARGRERLPVRGDPRQRVEPDWARRIRGIQIAHVIRALRRQGVENGFREIAVRVDDAHALTAGDIVHR